jgi:two-component system, sensor histidine kinase
MATLRDDAFARSTLRWAVTLVAAAGVMGIVVRALGGEPLDGGTAIGAAVLTLCAGVHVASRAYLRAATLVFLGASWFAAIGISATRGPTYVAMIPLFLLLVLVAGLILGVRAGAVLGALSCAAVGALIVMQDTGMLAVPAPPTTAYRAISAMLVTGGVTTVFSIALSRMRKLVDDLENARADLERTVELRTRSLVDARDAAQTASRAKSAFIANVSHELRTPLNAVVGMSEALLRTPLKPEQHEQADALRRGADALTAVVNDVLDLATLEAGGLSVERAPFDPRSVVHDVLALMGPEAARRKLTLSASIDKALPPMVMGDGRRVRQILLNLVGNALKFTESGDVLISARSEDGTLALSVKDSGPGIASSFLPRIFEPFARADETKPGLGLGLPIARELATRLGGSLDAESTPGAGAVFHLRVPAEVAQVSEPPTPVPVTPTAPLKVLVAEDNELNVAVLLALLHSLGHGVEIAHTGARALEMATQAPFDVVLMDVQMPELDGVEATRRLIATLGSRAPCIIGVTADAQPDKVKGFREAGMCDVLHKPLHLETLAAALARAPMRKAARDAARERALNGP